MFFSKMLSNPNYGDSIETSCISQNLPQMIMISLFKLVLYQHKFVSTWINTKNICSKRSNVFLLRLYF